MAAQDSTERAERIAAIEAPIRAAAERADYEQAVTLALRVYGGELLSFLRAMARDADLGAEAFAEAAEDLWRGLPAFRWGSSLRSWLYKIARNALAQLRRDPRRRSERNLPLSVAPEMENVVRTNTPFMQQTEVKDAFRELRAELAPEEYELLVLRLDRDMSWKDIARVLGDGNVEQDAATLRKRFERVRERLKKLARERGLL